LFSPALIKTKTLVSDHDKISSKINANADHMKKVSQKLHELRIAII